MSSSAPLLETSYARRLRRAEEDWRAWLWRLADVPLIELQDARTLADYINRLRRGLEVQQPPPPPSLPPGTHISVGLPPPTVVEVFRTEREIQHSLASGSAYYQQYIDGMLELGALFITWLASSDARFGADTPLMYLEDFIRDLEQALLAHLETLRASPSLRDCSQWTRFSRRLEEQIALRFEYWRQNRVPRLRSRLQDSWRGFRWLRQEVPEDGGLRRTFVDTQARVPVNPRLAQNAFAFARDQLAAARMPTTLSPVIPADWLMMIRFLERLACLPLLFPCDSPHPREDALAQWKSFSFPFATLPVASSSAIPLLL